MKISWYVVFGGPMDVYNFTAKTFTCLKDAKEFAATISATTPRAKVTIQRHERTESTAFGEVVYIRAVPYQEMGIEL